VHQSLSNSSVDIYRGMTRSRARPLRAETARSIVEKIRALGVQASFGRIMLELASSGDVKWHRTLRRYLDLLVQGGVLERRLRDVGSVNPQQLYRVVSERPRVLVGLAALAFHGLNWDVPKDEVREVSTDIEGLVRSQPFDSVLAASLEDCLVHELKRDAEKGTGGVELVVALLSTRRLDVPYLLRRADELLVGKAVRRLFEDLIRVTSAYRTEEGARVFLAVRERFLGIARQYAKMGFLRLMETPGKGDLGLDLVKGLTGGQVIRLAAKQLGEIG